MLTSMYIGNSFQSNKIQLKDGSVIRMTLEELKVRLDISIEDTSRDAKLQLLLADAIDFVVRTCNQSFLVNEVVTLPPTAQNVVAAFVRSELSGNDGITSESIGGMSQSFESSDVRNSSLTSKLRKAGLIRVRFTPFGGRRHGTY